MKYKRYKTTSCFVLLVITSVGQMHCHPRQRHEHYTQTKSYRSEIGQEVLWPVLGFFGAITGIFALGQWFGWWSESDEQLLQRFDRQQNLIKEYEPVLHVFHDNQLRYENSFEESLYQIALHKRDTASIETYVHALKECISKSDALINDMHKRSAKLKREREWHEVHGICAAFDQGAQALQKKAEELKALLAYLNTHMSYFKLFEKEDYTRNHYGQPLQLIEQYPEHALSRELRAWVMTKYTGPFGLLDFVKKLKNDIAKLEQVAQYPAYNYAMRIGYAQDLINRLYYMHKVLVADGEYTRLLTEYDRAQREKERLQLERERMQAEERKVAAREREAAAKEREARAQEEKNRLKYMELTEKQRYGQYR